MAAPATPGSNFTFSVAVWPGASVTGRPTPEIAKPVPDIAEALTVTAAVPVEDRISGCVTAESTGTLPKAKLEELIPNVGTAAPNCRAKVSDTPPMLALNVAACTEVTGEMLTVNSALLAPAGTVTAAGTTTALLLLARFTERPPLFAAAFSVTVQLSVPAPVIDPLVQVSPLNTGTPVPLRLTEVEDAVDELVVTVSSPVAVPVAAGLNCTFKLKLLLAATETGKLLWPLKEKDCPVTFS